VRAHEHRDVGRDLVVARASRVELSADGPDDLDQAPLDRHVDVLVLERDGEGVVLDLAADLLEAALDLREVLGADDLAAREHARMRERLRDVIGRQAPVEVDRRVERPEDRVLGLGEARHGAGVYERAAVGRPAAN
jgi:hypothetical protein